MLNENTVSICKQADEDMHTLMDSWKQGNPMSAEDGIAFLVNCKICDRMGMKDYWRHYQEEVYGAEFPKHDRMEHYHDEMPTKQYHEEHTYKEKSHSIKPLTLEEIKKWVSCMENQDGTKGGHWTMEQTTTVGEKHGVDFKKVPKEILFLGLNRKYSDNYNTALKYNAHTTPDFFLSLFMDDVMDEDTVSIVEREAVDYHYIAKM